MDSELLARLAEIVGERSVVSGDAVRDYEFPWQTHKTCTADAIVFPESTGEVSSILSLCNTRSQAVIPFGGTTNLVRGCETKVGDIILSLQKMNRIESVDKDARVLTAEAGASLQAAQDAADEAELFFPVDIGARSNCQLGGIVSTNAGGSKVIRYGMTRDSVLGLEVVLADGTVMSSMNEFIKNNSGFDLKHLFVGSEGVLGIITRVVFRLRGKAQSHNVALLACDDFENVTRVLALAQRQLDNTLTAFEVMWKKFYELAVLPAGRLPAPLSPGAGFYVLLESMGTDSVRDAAAFDDLLERLMDDELLSDGVIAKSDKERELFWDVRDEVEPVISDAFTFDLSLRSADIGRYIATLESAIGQQVADASVIGFGHLGDNNVHVSVLSGDMTDAVRAIVDDIVYQELARFGGAISAEHGIGLEKRRYLPVSRSESEIELMRGLKRLLDPNNVLNPGKVIDVS